MIYGISQALIEEIQTILNIMLLLLLCLFSLFQPDHEKLLLLKKLVPRREL